MSSKRRRRTNYGHVAWKNKKRRSSKKESRNWLDLPKDVLLLIFIKLGVFEILVNAKNVCSSWWKLAKEPLLYREIDFRAAAIYFGGGLRTYAKRRSRFERFSKDAVDRSCGQLVKLWCTDEFDVFRILLYVNSTNSIKSLHLGKNTSLSGVELTSICKGLTSVEELEIWFYNFPKIAVEEIGRTCQKLTSILLGKKNVADLSFDEVAASIVRNMPQLRRLGLVKYLLTNNGLRTILDGCPQLEHLGLQRCSCDQVEKNLLNKCATRIRNVIPPDGSTVGQKIVYERGQGKFHDDIINTVHEIFT